MFRKIKGCKLRKNYDLKLLSTFHIGGKAKYYLNCSNLNSLIKVIKICLHHNLAYKIIGAGSNLLFDDLGFNGAIINYTNEKIKFKNDCLTASSGCAMANLINSSKEHSLSGLENFVGIPCSLGGAICNNLGANNFEISALVQSVKLIRFYKKFKKKQSIKNKTENNCLNKNIALKNIKNNKINTKNKLIIKYRKISYKILKNSFSYRKNNFLNKFDIIYEINLKLIKSNKNYIQNNIIINYQKKLNNQPLDKYSAGSIFKRGKDFFPAKIIDDMGLKGFSIGGAEISNKHAGFIVNTRNASCQDVKTLINVIKEKVKQKYNLTLEEEIEYLYHFFD